MQSKLFYVACVAYMLVSCTIYAQYTFIRGLNGHMYSEGKSTISTVDNKYVHVSTVQSLSDTTKSISVSKLHPSGDIIWSKIVPHSGGDVQARKIIETIDGGYTFIGDTDDKQLVIYKLDPNGNIAWSTHFTDNANVHAIDLAEASDSSIVVLVNAIDSTQSADFSLYRLSSSGSLLWHKTYHSSGISSIQHDFGTDILITANDDILVCGHRKDSLENTPTDQRTFLCRISLAGNTIWTEEYHTGSQHPFTYSIIETSTGDILLTGLTHHTNSKLLVYKTNSVGNVLWSKQYDYGPIMHLIPTSIQKNDNENLIVFSVFDFFDFEMDIVMLSIDSSGSIHYSTVFDVGFWDYSTHIEQGVDNGFIITADMIKAYGEKSNSILIKTDDQGIAGCNQQPVSPVVSSHSFTQNTFQFSEQPTGIYLPNVFPITNYIQTDTIYCIDSTVLCDASIPPNNLETQYVCCTHPFEYGLSWNSIPGAVGYQVRAREKNGNMYNVVLNTMVADSEIEAGIYSKIFEWQVRTLCTPGNFSPWSSIQHINIEQYYKTSMSSKNADLLLWPNPATNRLYIDIDEPISQIHIIDLTGRIVYETDMLHSSKYSSISLDHIEAGTYQIQIQTHNNIYTKSFYKQ